MSDFLDRLKVEHDELEEKVAKLDAFIGTEKFDTLPPYMQGLLVAQQGAMTTYLTLLVLRINCLAAQELGEHGPAGD